MKQLELKTWGGKRKGAGRKNRSKTLNHMRRERANSKLPMHITMRLKPDMPTLRRHALHREFRRRIQCAAKFGLRILQYSLQENHLHLIVEATTHLSRARGMQSLIGQFAKSIRKLAGGKGSVFAGRYHFKNITSPLQMKRTLEYVLLNTAKHMKVIEHIDWFSSGPSFDRWPKLIGRRFADLIENQVLLAEKNIKKDIFEPQTWLARIGWLRAR